MRAGDGNQSQLTELILNRLSYTGPAVRLNTNRAFLERAVHLGFDEIGIVGVEAPVVCRQRDRVYAWQPLSADSAIGPTDIVIRIESDQFHGGTSRVPTMPQTARNPVTKPIRRNGQEPKPPGRTAIQADGENAGTSLAALLQDAEALHTTLRDARTSTARLISGLRWHRRQSRQLTETLKLLRALRLSQVVE